MEQHSWLRHYEVTGVDENEQVLLRPGWWELMDPEVSVLLHCAPWKGLKQQQVQVELSDRYNRQTDDALECHIEEVWSERLSKEPWLFNGAKFRLHSFYLDSPTSPRSSAVLPWLAPSHSLFSDSPDEQESRSHTDGLHDAALTHFTCDNLPGSGVQLTDGTQGKASGKLLSRNETVKSDSRPLLTLKVGLTCYKDYLGTNWSGQVAELQRRGEVEHRDHVALLAQPLGVGAVMCTDDGQVVLIRRSKRVAEAGGQLDIPGGHPEPKVVCESLGQAVSEEQISVTLLQERPEAVVSELFSSVCAEIRDEVNVPLSSLGEPVLMGVALNHTSAGRPSAEFYISCSLTSDEVRKLYWKGGAEANESTDIVFLSRAEVMELDRSSPLWSELCPSAKGAVLLFQTVKPHWEQKPTSEEQNRSS